MRGQVGGGGRWLVAVCVTVAVDPEVDVEPGELGGGAPGLPRVVNPADLAALEAALRLRDREPRLEVVAVSVSSPADADALRPVLALGADRLECVWGSGFAGLDAPGVASVLAGELRRLGPDLIVFGGRALDGAGGGVGPAVAELLTVPLLVGVTALTLEEEAVRAQRVLGSGLRAAVECPPPAVAVVDERAFPARYPRLRDRFRARRSEIPVRLVEPEDLGPGPGSAGWERRRIRVVALAGPKPNVAGVFVPDQTLSPEAQLNQLMGGVVAASVAGGVESAGGVDEAVRLLEEQGFLDGG